MPSIVEGYSYDVFISYRRKDNKYDGWVTEFVDHLKKELEATFKEDISIYFDENPHDGLLETHSVDKSLEDKLKCLIFIPIISQTYCDLKSFAWQHELCAFNKLAKEDGIGRDIKLASGNVASRILPVRIHDLDPEDKTLLENELGGVLRGIEFIYKEPGVNRPLTPKDSEDKNLNKTNYRNQINKVANAVKEIITALKKQSQHPETTGKENITIKYGNKKHLSTKLIAGTIAVLVIIILGILFIPKFLKPIEQIEKSIAVLPFNLLSDEPDKQYLADGMMDEITLHLSKIKDLRVLGRTSTEQYRNQTKTLTDIGKDLDVNYLLEGSFQKFGDSVRLIVQLIKTSKEGHVWANSYDRLWKYVFSVQSEVAQSVARELKASITPLEQGLIEKVPTVNMAAYNIYLKASDYLKDYEKTSELSSYYTAVNLFKSALGEDSTFAKAYTGLAKAYFDRYQWETYFKENYLDSMKVLIDKALSIDNELDEAYFYYGRYYRSIGDLDKALKSYNKSIELNPNYYLAYQAKGVIIAYINGDYVNGLVNYHKALALVRGNERADLLRLIGFRFLDVGFFDKARSYFQEAFAMDKDSADYLNNLAWIKFSLEEFEETIKLMRRVQEIDSLHFVDLMFINVPAGHKDEAFILAKKKIARYRKLGQPALQEAFQIGYAFWQVGKYQEAKSYFNQQINYGEESIKLRRNISQLGYAQYDLASTYAFLGDTMKAYKNLKEFDQRNFYNSWQVSYAKHNPFMKSISSEEQYKRILQNMESKYLEEHERVKKWLEEQGML